MRLFVTLSNFALTISMSFAFSSDADAQLSSQLNNNNGYYPYVIALPKDRQWIRDTPIEHRPDRPLHFYGNIVRQSYTVKPTNRVLRTGRPTRIPLITRRW